MPENLWDREQCGQDTGSRKRTAGHKTQVHCQLTGCVTAGKTCLGTRTASGPASGLIPSPPQSEEGWGRQGRTKNRVPGCSGFPVRRAPRTDWRLTPSVPAENQPHWLLLHLHRPLWPEPGREEWAVLVPRRGRRTGRGAWEEALRGGG